MSSRHQETYKAIAANIGGVMQGQRETVRKLLAAFISDGHVLLEDYPGTGKTTLAKALARSFEGADFRRIQFTPDLLPSDILGVSILNPKDNSFKFHPGPIFANILLADEINRASPRTQSALLEAMAERQATIEGNRHVMPDPFLVIATQNPVEFRGTYPLPEAQMDRFAMQLSLGYVTPEEEVSIISNQQVSHPLDSLGACASLADIRDMRMAAQQIRLSDELKRYIIDLTGATRKVASVQLAASPRASITLMKTAQALAMFDGEDFVSPDHIHEIAADVIAHRLVLDPQARFSGMTGRNIVGEVIEQIPAPA
jgi:MoxR-like ATPase